MADEIYTLVANMGFAIAVAAYLVNFMTKTINSKLDKLIETQYRIAETLQAIAKTQEMIIELLRKKM